MMHLPEKAFFRVDEVAGYYSVSPRSVREWIRLGKMKAIKVSGAVRVARDEVLGAASDARTTPLQG